MRAVLFLGAATAALACAAPVAAQSSAPEPPRSQTAGASQSAPVTSSTPQTPQRGPAPHVDAADLLSTVATGKAVGVDLVTSTANLGMKSADVAADAARASNALGNMARGASLTATAIGVRDDLAQGNCREAAKKVVAATVNELADKGLSAICGTAMLSSGGLATPGCIATIAVVQAARFCAETYYETSLGQIVADYGFKAYDAVTEYQAQQQQMQQNFRQAQVSADAKRIEIASQNEAFALEQIRAAQMAPSHSSSGYDDMLFMNSLMQGLGTAMAPPLAPLAPVPSATTPGGPCHPGHDEASHPGGCHKQPLGAN